MILNRIYIFILGMWKTLIELYDDSCVGRWIAKICSFFGRKCESSRILVWFKNCFMSTKYVGMSFTAKLISFPFSVLK